MELHFRIDWNHHYVTLNFPGVLEIKKDHVESARAFFQTSSSLNSHLYEPQVPLKSQFIASRLAGEVFRKPYEGFLPPHPAPRNLIGSFHSVQFNFGLLANQIGDLQSSFNAIKTSQDLYGDHTDSIDLMNQLKKHFAMIWGRFFAENPGTLLQEFFFLSPSRRRSDSRILPWSSLVSSLLLLLCLKSKRFVSIDIIYLNAATPGVEKKDA